MSPVAVSSSDSSGSSLSACFIDDGTAATVAVGVAIGAAVTLAVAVELATGGVGSFLSSHAVATKPKHASEIIMRTRFIVHLPTVRAC